MGEAIDYALPGRGVRRRGWVIWVVGIVLGAGLAWFGPGAWREGVVWVMWKVAPWVQAGEGRVVWDESGVVYQNWAWSKWLAEKPHNWSLVQNRSVYAKADVVIHDMTVDTGKFRVLIEMWMTKEVGGTSYGSIWVFEGSSDIPIWVEPKVASRSAHESGLGPRRERIVTRPSDRIEVDGVPMNAKVWAGRVDPGDPNRFLVDYEWYGKRETFEVRVTVEAGGKPVVETKWLGGK